MPGRVDVESQGGPRRKRRSGEKRSKRGKNPWKTGSRWKHEDSK